MRARRDLLVGAAVCGLAFLLYLPTLTHAFINWDDGSVIEQASRLLPLSGTSLRWMFTSFELSTYQPFAWLVYAGLFSLGGPAPAPYHAASLLLHVFACASYFLVARRLLGHALWAGAAALLFAWHPLQVESVAAAASIADMLAVSLSLGAAAAYLYSEERRGLYALSLILFVLAALSRWQAFALPFALAGLDYVRGRAVVSRRLLPFFALAALVVGVYAGVKGEQHHYHSVAARPREAAYGLLFYAWKWLAPVNLLPVYLLDEAAAGRAGAAALGGAFGALVLVASTARRWPGLAAAALVYGATLAPTLLLTGAGPVYGHDRYTYLACAGFPLLAAWLGARARRGGRKAAAVALGTLMVGGAGALTTAQLDVWRDSNAFWEHALDVRPEWPLALDRLGEAQLGAGRTREAIATFRRSARVAPETGRKNMAFAYTNLGVELAQENRLDEAAGAFREALLLAPELPQAKDFLGRVERARKAKASGTRRRGSAPRPSATAN